MNVHEEQTLLLLSIYQKYPGLILPPVSLKTLAKKEWFIKSLMKISQNPAGYDVLPLCYQVIKQCIMYVKQHQKPGMSDEEGEMLKKIKLLGKGKFVYLACPTWSISRAEKLRLLKHKQLTSGRGKLQVSS